MYQRQIFTSKDLTWICSAVVATIVVYGYSLFNFTMSIDNEYTDLFLQKISIGRWGGAFLKETILPAPYAPFFTHLIFCVFLCASAVFAAKLLNFNGVMSGVFSVLCISFPSLFYQADFAMQSDAVSIGLFLGVISSHLVIYSVESNKKLYVKTLFFLSAIALYCYSISIYQSIFNTAVGMVSLYYAKQYSEENKTLNFGKILIYIAWAILSISLYFAITKLILKIYSVNGTSYLLNQVGWGKNAIIDNSYVISSKLISLVDGTAFYGSQAFVIAFACFILHLVYITFTGKGLFAFALSLISFISPFILVIILASDLPPRTFTFQPFVYAFFITLVLNLLSQKVILNKLPLIVCIASVWSGSLIYSKLMFSDYMSWQSDRITGSEIVSSIRSKFPNYKEGVTPVYFHGSLDRVNIWKQPNSDVFGESFFQWDGGNNSRIKEFLKVNMIANITLATETQALDVKDIISSKEKWPAGSSIFEHNGAIIVKLGDAYGYLGGLSQEK